MLGMHKVKRFDRRSRCRFRAPSNIGAAIFTRWTEQVSVTADRRVDVRQTEAVQQAGLVRCDDRASQVLFQRIDDAHTADPGPGDQHAIRFLRAGRAYLLIHGSISCSNPIPYGTSRHFRPGSYRRTPAGSVPRARQYCRPAATVLSLNRGWQHQERTVDTAHV